MKKQSLLIDQLESRMATFRGAHTAPPLAWIRSVRTALGISLRQLASRLSVSSQNVLAMEQREAEGSITIRSLREVADALDMELVYGLVPKDGTLDALIERKAQALALQIVRRTNATMTLEDQANSPARLKRAVRERTETLKREMPKALWD